MHRVRVSSCRPPPNVWRGMRLSPRPSAVSASSCPPLKVWRGGGKEGLEGGGDSHPSLGGNVGYHSCKEQNCVSTLTEFRTHAEALTATVIKDSLNDRSTRGIPFEFDTDDKLCGLYDN